MIHSILSSLPFMTETRANLMIDAFFPLIKAGIMTSFPLAIASFILGVTLALMVALIRTSPSQSKTQAILLKIVKIYVSVIRGTPLLVQLFVVFYGLYAIGIKLSPLTSAIICFSLHTGAYASETIRTAILSVPKGQWEAGFSIGMTYLQTFKRIIAPQATRVAIPPLSNDFIGLFKHTSLAALVTVTEMFRVAQNYANSSYDFLPIYIEVGLIYWCICAVLFAIQARIERHFSRHIHK